MAWNSEKKMKNLKKIWYQKFYQNEVATHIITVACSNPPEAASRLEIRYK